MNYAAGAATRTRLATSGMNRQTSNRENAQSRPAKEPTSAVPFQRRCCSARFIIMATTTAIENKPEAGTLSRKRCKLDRGISYAIIEL